MTDANIDQPLVRECIVMKVHGCTITDNIINFSLGVEKVPRFLISVCRRSCLKNYARGDEGLKALEEVGCHQFIRP